MSKLPDGFGAVAFIFESLELIMGRELQKKKNRSSTPRVRLKPKSKKRILSNPVIAANWLVLCYHISHSTA